MIYLNMLKVCVANKYFYFLGCAIFFYFLIGYDRLTFISGNVRYANF